jgi:arsenite methyltransferase
MTHTTDPETIRSAVRARYAAAATAAQQAESTSCCGASAPKADAISSNLYAIDEVAELPSAAVLASLGCGNPTALAELAPGETVLDLGSGGGIDVLLSARRVGPTGFAYGLDMTDEMLALARRNAADRGVRNVEFLKGEIEHIPLPDTSVDVIISNCVINLSADKPQVLREAFRVLRPGGRLAVSDIVVQGQVPDAVRQSLDLWAGCLGGALEDTAYRRLLTEAGFGDISIEVTRVHDGPQAGEAGGRFVSAFVRARKPAS